MVEKPQRLPPGERPFVVPCARLSLDAPWRWLRLGWQDFWRAPRLSLIFGMAIMLISVAVSALAQLVILLVWSRAGMMLSAFFPFDANDTAMLVEYLAVGSAIGTVFAALTLTWPGPVRQCRLFDCPPVSKPELESGSRRAGGECGSNDDNRQSEEKMLRSVVLTSIALGCGHLIAEVARAETPQQIVALYAAQAREQNPAFAGFSAERGQAFWLEPHKVKGATGMWSCASCHLKDARYSVLAHQTDIPCRTCHVINDWEHPDPKHAKKRHIEPFAPSANPKRLGDPHYVETFLRLNCRLLLERECTTLEKGDVLTYLMTFEGGSKGDLINVGSRSAKRAAVPQ